MFDYSLPVAPGPNQQIVGTPQDDQRRRAMADALAKQGMDSSPIRSKWQGVARLGDALAGALINRQTDAREASGQESARQQMADLLGGQSSGSSGGTSMGDALIGKQPAVADTSAPRGYRNNNPLNIEAGGFTKAQPGFAGSDGRFAKFENMDQGTQAANTLLDTYQNKHGLNTVAGIVGRWAPSADGNNVMAYAADVSKRLGIGPNDPIPPEMRPQLIAAMAQHENGRPMPTQGTPPVQVASLDQSAGVAPQGAPQAAATSPQGMPPQATPPAAPMPPQAAAAPVQMAQNGEQPPMQPQPQQQQFDPKKLMAVLSNPYATPAQQQIASQMLQQIQKQQMTPPELKMQKDMMGQDHPYVWDPVKRTYTPLEQGAQAAGPADTSNEGIMAAAEKQYPGVTSRVEQLYRGEGGMPNARSNKIDGPAMQLIQKVHPDWDMAMWTRKSDTEKDFSSKGKSGIAIQNLAKIANHSKDLVEGMSALKNGQYPALNWVGNTIDQAKGKQAPTNFHINVTAVADEMASLMRREGMSDASIESWKKAFNRDASEEQQKGAMRTVARLIEDRMTPLGEEYTRNKGGKIDLWASHPESKKAFDAVNEWANSPIGGKSESTAAPKHGDAVKVTTPAEAAKLPKGTRIILPDGSPGVVP